MQLALGRFCSVSCEPPSSLQSASCTFHVKERHVGLWGTNCTKFERGKNHGIPLDTLQCANPGDVLLSDELSFLRVSRCDVYKDLFGHVWAPQLLVKISFTQETHASERWVYSAFIHPHWLREAEEGVLKTQYAKIEFYKSRSNTQDVPLSGWTKLVCRSYSENVIGNWM